MQRTLLAIIVFLAYAPSFANAITPPTNFQGVVSLALSYVSLLVPLVFALTFIVIIWGVVKAWIIHGGDTEKIQEGRMIALWGVLGLAVMAGLWGLIAILRTSLFSL